MNQNTQNNNINEKSNDQIDKEKNYIDESNVEDIIQESNIENIIQHAKSHLKVIKAFMLGVASTLIFSKFNNK